jgi:hypothetical protein
VGGLTEELRRTHRRRHSQHHGVRGLRVRVRFPWWQLLIAVLGILVTAAAILAIEPWRLGLP